jgi:hypothetical protein
MLHWYSLSPLSISLKLYSLVSILYLYSLYCSWSIPRLLIYMKILLIQLVVIGINIRFLQLLTILSILLGHSISQVDLIIRLNIIYFLMLIMNIYLKLVILLRSYVNSLVFLMFSILALGKLFLVSMTIYSIWANKTSWKKSVMTNKFILRQAH